MSKEKGIWNIKKRSNHNGFQYNNNNICTKKMILIMLLQVFES